MFPAILPASDTHCENINGNKIGKHKLWIRCGVH